MAEDVLQKRFSDLLQQSSRNSTFYFTDFITQSDASAVYSIARDHEVTVFGGHPDSERVLIRFGDPEEFGYEIPFPISILEIRPLQEKFGEELSHRDYLGSLMNLGIERDTIGDIVIRGKTAYLFCVDRIAPYIMENLSRVKHTTVMIKKLAEAPEDVKPLLKEREVIVSSLRLDGILSKLYHLSRSDAKALFTEGHVLVNGKLCMNAAYSPKEEDSISVRGHGKTVFKHIAHETRKGRIAVLLLVYV